MSPTPRSYSIRAATVALVTVALVLVTLVPSQADARRRGCPDGMASVFDKFCIDRYEGAVEYKEGRRWLAHSPYESVQGKTTRAVSRRNVVPQAYISRNEAEAACKGARKRLCTDDEWVAACKGKRPTLYPYGDTHVKGRCNDAGVSPLNHFYGTREGPPLSAYGWEAMNDPKLNKLRGTVARTGSFGRCRNSFGLYDMVGNLHEWTAARGGTFRGGYYLDNKINGEGCEYRTTAHNATYHDYSTGFRCCADLR